MPNWDEQNIIKLLGIESLPDARKVEIIEMATDLVQKRLVLRVMDALPPEKQEQMAKILDERGQELLQDFMDKNVANFPDLMMEEVVKVKEELGNLVKDIDKDKN